MIAVRPPSLLTRREAELLAVAGLLLALAFPPLPFGLLSLVALTPLLAVLHEDPRPGFRRGFLQGALLGSLFYLTLLSWLWDLARFTPLILPTWALSCVYLGALVGLATGTVQWVRARTGRSPALLLPFAWIGLEKLLQYGDLRFTWGVLADTLTQYPLLIQTAELWGALGLSFLIVAANGLVYTWWREGMGSGDAGARPRVRQGAALTLAALAVLTLAYGAVRWNAYRGVAGSEETLAGLDGPTQATGTVRIAVIQPNIPQEARDDPDREHLEKARLFDLSRSALLQAPDLVVWPETATPWLRYEPAYLADLLELCCGGSGPAGGEASSPGGGTPFLVGGLDAEEAGRPGERLFNAAFMISAAGQLTGVYRKVLLVPMTEQVPYSKLLAFLKPERWSGSFRAGEGFIPLSFTARRPAWEGEVAAGVPICYEVIFPGAIRAFRMRGARLIVTITNDAWFGRTAAPFQHFSHLKLRAVENRIGIARSANTGISGFVSARGDVLEKTDIFEPGFLVRDLPLAGPPTLYSRWGDWVLPAAWVGLALALGGAGRKRSRRSLDTQGEAP